MTHSIPKSRIESSYISSIIINLLKTWSQSNEFANQLFFTLLKRRNTISVHLFGYLEKSIVEQIISHYLQESHKNTQEPSKPSRVIQRDQMMPIQYDHDARNAQKYKFILTQNTIKRNSERNVMIDTLFFH